MKSKPKVIGKMPLKVVQARKIEARRVRFETPLTHTPFAEVLKGTRGRSV